MAFRNVVVPGFYRSLNDFNAFLEPEKKKKEDRSSKRYYSVERVISRRTNKGNIAYLIKWQDYSSYDCTWEDESHLTPDLTRSFERPVVSRGRLEEHKDILVYNVSVKLKSKSRLPHHFHFHHDVFRLMFCNKGSKSRDGEAIMLDKADFHHLHLPAVWDQHLDKNGDGVVIGFPIRMQIHLSWSYKMRAFQHGKLVTRPKMPLEKLSIQFVSIPFSCENL